MSISVVIPSHTNTSDKLDQDCIQGYKSTASREVEIILSKSPASFAVNVNNGWKKALGDIILISNNDVTPLPGWDMWLEQSASKGIVSLSPDPGCGWGFAVSWPLTLKVGMLDENLVNSYEDYDFFIRAALQGYTRVLPNRPFAIHQGGVTLATLWGSLTEQRPKRLQQCLRNRDYMLKKWPGVEVDEVPTLRWSSHAVQIMQEWKRSHAQSEESIQSHSS